MVSTETALDYLKKKHEAEAEASGQSSEQTTQQSEDKQPEAQGTETSNVQTEAEEKKEEPVKTDEPKVEEKKEDEKPSEQPKEEVKSNENDKTEKSEQKQDKTPPKHKYTHEERVAHKFAKQNEKLRERGETIKKQQETIDSLNKELEKYKGLRLEDFENNMEAYADWKAKEASMQNEVKFRTEMMEREQREAAELETARREELSFEDEDEREEYRDMLRKNGPQFYDALQKADADYLNPNGRGEIAKAVLGYLSGVDKYPVVLKQLMDLNTGALKRVFSGSKDPEIIRGNLHQLTQEILSGQKKTSEQTTVAQNHPNPVKPIPVIGKQVTANSKPSEPVHDRVFWTNYARNHR